MEHYVTDFSKLRWFKYIHITMKYDNKYIYGYWVMYINIAIILDVFIQYHGTYKIDYAVHKDNIYEPW